MRNVYFEMPPDIFERNTMPLFTALPFAKIRSSCLLQKVALPPSLDRVSFRSLPKLRHVSFAGDGCQHVTTDNVFPSLDKQNATKHAVFMLRKLQNTLAAHITSDSFSCPLINTIVDIGDKAETLTPCRREPHQMDIDHRSKFFISNVSSDP